MAPTNAPPDRLIRIAITGPESSGKTVLAEMLAAEYSATLITEFARDFLNDLTVPYTEEHLTLIAKQQLAMEDKAEDELVILDTDVLVLFIWYQEKYGHVPGFLKRRMQKPAYDLHLLMKPDIPYAEDPLRENPARRDYFFELFHEELERRGWPYQVIDGTYEERFIKAKSAIDLLIHGRFKP